MLMSTIYFFFHKECLRQDYDRVERARYEKRPVELKNTLYICIYRVGHTTDSCYVMKPNAGLYERMSMIRVMLEILLR